MRVTLKAGLVAAVVAALVAGGTATAASLITGKQIKDRSITGRDIKTGSLTGKQIKSDSIGVRDLTTGAFDALAGSQGPAGPAGPAGPQGPAGPAGTVSVVSVTSPHQFVPPRGTTTDMRADCPPGYVAVGTGFHTGTGNARFVQAFGTIVGGFVDNNDYDTTIETYVQAICASGVGYEGARSGSRTSDVQRFEAAEAQARGAH